MSDIQIKQDNKPFLVSTGVTIDVNGVATVTGAVTLFTKKFSMQRQAALSFFAQCAGGATGSWKVFASNDYEIEPGRGNPGTWVDVTAAFGAAGLVTPPGAKNFVAAVAASDFFSSWAFPFSAVQFQYQQTAGGPETVSGQFFCGES